MVCFFVLLSYQQFYVEYDPNPLQSLGKRNKQMSKITDPNQPSTSANVFSVQHDSGEQMPTREEKEAYK